MTQDVAKSLTRSDSAQQRAALICGLVLIVLGAVITPFAATPLPVVSGYIPAFCAAMFTVNGILAVFLFSAAKAEKRLSATILGVTYCFVAAMFIPFALSFPGAMVSESVIGQPGTVVWIWVFWHAGFGILSLAYVYSIWRERRVHDTLAPALLIFSTLLVATALTYIASEWQPFLPSLLSSDNRALFRGTGQIVPLAILAIDVIALLGILVLRKSGAEQHWLAVGMVAACFDVWLTLKGIERFSLGWYVSKMGSLMSSLAILVWLLLKHNTIHLQLVDSHRRLQTLSKQDGLTQLGNRRSFDEVLKDEWLRAARSRQEMSLLMIDIDFFKKFNDRYGHIGGDACLRQVAGVLATSAMRPTDFVARYGGEEFAIILASTSEQGAREIAEKVRRSVENLRIEHCESPFGIVSLSIGFATLMPTAEVPCIEIIETADKALYSAKNLGRNRAVAASCLRFTFDKG